MSVLTFLVMIVSFGLVGVTVTFHNVRWVGLVLLCSLEFMFDADGWLLLVLLIVATWGEYCEGVFVCL
jgi:hypothetical protein